MNNTSTNASGTSGKIWTRLFIGTLLIQALLELVVGGTALFNFPVALEGGFGIPYSSELDILGIAIGLYVLLLGILMILAAVWTSRGNKSGITIGIITGAFLFLFGLSAFLKIGDFQAIIIDSLRGVLTVLFGYMASKELKK